MVPEDPGSWPMRDDSVRDIRIPDECRERMHRLADTLETLEDVTIEDSSSEKLIENGFLMKSFTHECGTPACICGWANRQRLMDEGRSELQAHSYGIDSEETAIYLIGQDAIEAGFEGELFEPSGLGVAHDYHHMRDVGEPGHITAEHAARCLRTLADEGIVDWKGTAP